MTRLRWTLSPRRREGRLILGLGGVLEPLAALEHSLLLLLEVRVVPLVEPVLPPVARAVLLVALAVLLVALVVPV